MRSLNQELQINGLCAGANEAESMPLTSPHLLTNYVFGAAAGKHIWRVSPPVVRRLVPRTRAATRLLWSRAVVS